MADMRKSNLKKGYLTYSFREPKKYYVIVKLVTVISIVFLGVVYAFYHALLAVNYSKAVYGHQHITAYGVTKEQLQVIQSNGCVDSSVPFYRTEFKASLDATYNELISGVLDVTVTYVIDQIPADYFDLTEYELTAGRMPVSDTEILCTSGDLIQYGLLYDNMIGSKITIMGKEYTVVGLYTVHRLYFYPESTEYHFFTGNPSESNAIALKANDYDAAMTLLVQSPFSDLECEWNENLSVIRSNVSSINRDCYYVFAIIVVTVLTIITHCMKMLLDQHKTNIGIYRLIGISTVRLSTAVWYRICFALLPLLPVIQGCLYLAVKGVIGFYNRLFTSSDFTKEFYTVQFDTIFLIPIVMIALYLGIGWVAVYIQVRTAGLNSIRKAHRLKWRKKNKRVGVTPHAIAKRHLKIAKIAGVLTTGCICFACISFTTANIAVARQIGNRAFYQKYDYFAELDYNMLLCNPEALVVQIMDKLTIPQMDGVVAEPYFYSVLTISVPKSCVNSEYINVLAQTNGNIDEIIDPYQQNLEVPVYICGFTDAMWENVNRAMGGDQYCLQDGCATAFQYLVNHPSDVLTLDFEHVTTITQEHNSTQPYQVSINRVETRFPLEVAFQESGLVIAVNIPTYERLTGMKTPWCIGYYVEEYRDDAFTSLFAGCNFVNLINVNESKSYRQCQQAEAVLQRIVFVFMMLFAFSVLCMITTLRMRYYSHEYRIMSVLGIPSSQIVKAVRLEVLYTMLPSIVLSNIINALAVFVDSIYHVEQYNSMVALVSIGAFNLILIVLLLGLMATSKRMIEVL